MKKMLLLLALVPAVYATAQTKTRTLKKVAELKMPKTADDDMPGTRGASVAWHPVQKKYYAAMAGNMGYPLAVFDAKGKRLSDDELTCQVDTRGLWYNNVTKMITGNGYGENGWFNYKLDSKGIVSSNDVIFEGQNQPDGQCVGTFNTTSKKVTFLKGAKVYFYSPADATPGDSLLLHWGRTAKEGRAEDAETVETPYGYNNTTVIYSGIAGAELGVLNTGDTQVELYDAKKGFLSQILKLPADVTVEASFNFAFTNGIYWFFDMEKRIWKGYK